MLFSYTGAAFQPHPFLLVIFTTRKSRKVKVSLVSACLCLCVSLRSMGVSPEIGGKLVIVEIACTLFQIPYQIQMGITNSSSLSHSSTY